MKHALTVYLAALLLCAGPVAAQAPISTDRPGFGTGTAVVAPGRVQVEVGTPGVELTTFDGPTARDPQGNVLGEVDQERRIISFPTLVRVGLIDRLEVRVNSGIYTFDRLKASYPGEVFDDQTFKEEGFPGVAVGLKGQVLRAPGYTLSLVPRVTLPVGDDAFTSDRAGFAADAVLGVALPQQFGLTLVTGGALDPVENAAEDYAASGSFVGVVGRALGERAGGYVEGAFVPNEDAENAGYFGARATYQIIPTAQLDVFFDRGLTDTSTDWLFGGGVSIRFGD